MTRKAVSELFVVFIFFSSLLSAQELLYTFVGKDGADFLGYSVSIAGDIDNDGYADVIVGSPNDGPSPGDNPGGAYVYSGGKNGLELYHFSGNTKEDEEDYEFGQSVSGAGDVNNDGFPDVIVGAYVDDPDGKQDAGSAHVYSGIDGSELHHFKGQLARDYFGCSVSGASDVNNDGFADVIVGASGIDSAYVFSGKNGSLLFQFQGHIVGTAGDIDNDGYADVIVGDPDDDPNGWINAGSARVYSGSNGSVLRHFTGDSDSDWDSFGCSVDGAGDINNDGYADVIVGAEGDSQLAGRAGSAYVYSGKDGSFLFPPLHGESALDSFGHAVSGAGDVDNDGYADVIIANDPNAKAGSVYIYSGKDGSTKLCQLTGRSARVSFGYSVSGAGDVNHDGYPDIIVGSPNEGINSGSAFVYSLAKLFPPLLQCPIYDLMQSELSHNIEIFGINQPICPTHLKGEIGVERLCPILDGQGRKVIDTKIFTLHLTGDDPTCGPVTISLNSNIPSTGQVVSQSALSDFPADSFFDVFIKVEIPNLGKTFLNCTPAIMRCTVDALPPIGCAYQLDQGFLVALYFDNVDCNSPGNPVGQISVAGHTPTETIFNYQRPGDVNQDTKLDLSDAVWLLELLFLDPQKKLPCEGSGSSNPGLGDRTLADVNNDGRIDLSDPIYILGYLFLGEKEPFFGKKCYPINTCPDLCRD
jgi:hypothetical protein